MSNNWIPRWNPSTTSLPPDMGNSKELPSLESKPDLSRQPSNGARGSLPTKSSRNGSPSKVRLKRPTSAKEKLISHKASTTSLASMSAGNWLSWGPKSKLSNGNHGSGPDEDRDDQQLDEDYEEPPDGTTDIDDENNDDSNDNEEVDDHVVHKGNRKKLWSFWNGNSSSDSERKELKSPEKPSIITNTMLKSTPSIPSKKDLVQTLGENFDQRTADAVPSHKLGPKHEDDAVLYKPHDSSKQFNKINTHRNENLKENIIVPDWRSCLPTQSSLSLLSGSSNIATGVGSQPFDLKNWKGFLSHLTSRFGFGSQNEKGSSERDDEDQSNNGTSAVEKELNLLQERSYKLYGKSLLRLPHHKRACLPTYSRCYKVSEDHLRKKQKKADDGDEDNSVTITNDAKGNLLINYPEGQSNSKSPVFLSDIVSQKAGEPRRIKKILIIGVHGFFPTRMIRPLIGAPKGTSLKFANEAEKAIIRYCVENDMMSAEESHDISIQKIALEKEGKFFDRVEFFFEILSKWQKELNEADFIFIAAHSQGCVVSIILLAKLIKFGMLRHPQEKRIGILAMAGVNNGPFYGADKSFFMKAYSAIEHDSLMELFELTKFDSRQSLSYKESMQVIVNANVKICFIGSINDQLVPLYSALASHIFHPNIYRACYIDHSSRTPLFIQKLVSLCCQMQNLGFFDNNVIKELSTALAGTLTGGGHSKIYNDGKVYDLGLKFVLDTDDIVIPQTVPLASSKEESDFNELAKPPITNTIYVKEYNVGKIGTNPFILPWCLRGLIFNVEKNWPTSTGSISVEHSLEIRKKGRQEIDELYELFDSWNPDSKILRDLKFRLNGIRASKL